MIRKITIFLLVLLDVLFLPLAAYADDKEKKMFPSSVPISHKPTGADAFRWGAGYNRLIVVSDWEDNFFTDDIEDIGELEYTIHNLAVGFRSSKSHASTFELAILLGIIEQDEKDTQYFSPAIGKDVLVDISGDGVDLGARLLWSTTFFQQKRGDGRPFIDWNYAVSFHGAFFYLDGTFEGRSTDGLNANVYDEEEWGIFLRPIAALQPVIHLSEKVLLIPYVGLGTKIALSEYYWEDTLFVTGGSSMPSQLGDDTGFEFDTTGIEAYFGFDIGIIFGSTRKQELSIGAALSKVFGDTDEDFNEFHIVYYF